MIRWNVTDSYHTIVHPLTGKSTRYPAVRVEHPDGRPMVKSEWPKARSALSRRAPKTATITPIYVDGMARIAYAVAYWEN